MRLYAVGGNNHLMGGHGTDTIVFGTGDDTALARSNAEGGGRKTFVWGVGSGNATVHYFNPARVDGDGLAT